MQLLETFTCADTNYSTFDNIDNIALQIYSPLDNAVVLQKEGFETQSDAIFYAEKFINNL